MRPRLRTPPTLSVSEWADAHRILSPESSAEPGRWLTSRAPYQRGMMDAISDPLIERVVFMTSSQVGKTEIVNNVVGYFVDQDPAPLLVVMPTLDMAKAWSVDRLANMLRDSPRLQGKVRDARTRDSGNTMLHKVYPGGHLTVVGANSAAGLKSRPMRIVACDEVDAYPASAGTEGDPVALAFKRTTTFWNRKLILTSTPTVKGFSRIESEWAQTDQRHYFVPCPHCDERQVLRWPSLDFSNRVEPVYICAHCKGEMHEYDKRDMLAAGEWVATYPDRKIAGFHLNALYSPWAKWAELVAEWRAIEGDRFKLQVFVNTALAETWEEDAERVSGETLESRRERYPSVCPMGVGLLTAGVDVQGDRLEIQVKGWGRGEESWLIHHEQIFGDPALGDVWAELDRILLRGWEHQSGTLLAVQACMIDTGGHHAEHVYRFCKTRQRSRRVYASKGANAAGRPLLGRPSKANKYGVRLMPIGTDTAKDLIFARLRIASPSAGYMHFPDWVDPEYFAQLTAEKVVTRYYKGRPIRSYEKIRPRNEALDLEVLCTAALVSLGSGTVRNLGAYVDQLSPPTGDDDAEGAGGEAEPARPGPIRPSPIQHPFRPSGWVTGWRRGR